MSGDVIPVLRDRVPIGHVQSFGPGRYLAHVLMPDGKAKSLGFFQDRKAAGCAVAAAAQFRGPPDDDHPRAA